MIIVTYPHPALKLKTKPINLDEHTLEELRTLGKEMLKIMYQNHGVGLSANQVGINARMFVFDVSPERNSPHILINPTLTFKEGETRTREGCLSLPGISIDRTRFNHVKVKFYDPYLDAERELDCEPGSFMSVVVQHEYDHLDGITMIDDISSLKRERALTKLRKAK
jgi:peptide deformylase